MARQFASLVRLASDAFYTTDLEQRLTSLNLAAEQLYGHSEERVLGKPATVLIGSGSVAAQHDFLDRLLAGKEISRIDAVTELGDGRKIEVSQYGMPLRDEHGEVTGACVATRDLTDAIHEHAALLRAQERFELSFDKALIGMVITDTWGNCIRANTALCDLISRSRPEVVGHQVSSFIHPEDLQTAAELVRTLQNSDVMSHVREFRLLRPDGEIIWAEVAISVIHDEEDRPSHAFLQLQDVTERREAEERLRHMADHDPLTGLVNRRCFDRELRDHLRRVDRYASRGAVLMVDLDNFKNHNDTYGHGAGDRLLVEVAETLRARMRSNDLVGRIGGDEFAILVPEGERAQAIALAASLVELLGSIGANAAVHGEMPPVSASIGVLCLDPQRPLSAEAVLLHADHAMYRAKASGKNRFAVYEPDERPGV